VQKTVTDTMMVHWGWIGYHPWAIDWHRDFWPWWPWTVLDLMPTLHYIASRVMPYMTTCCLVLWYMVWNGNSIGQIHVPWNVFLV